MRSETMIFRHRRDIVMSINATVLKMIKEQARCTDSHDHKHDDNIFSLMRTLGLLVIKDS